ncbi:hypothetical protein G9A89_005204 [Geosiphon pyriformis]|nr:hypothetical protein G9A89_005204 [Geosiphon pyriformis]
MVLSGCFWSSETDNTTKSDSIDMKEKFLVEETSFNYEKNGALTSEDSEQTPKSSKIQTKKALSKPLGKINFLDDNGDDILLDKSVVLPFPLKNLVNVSVRKSFALNIGLNKVAGKFSQEKYTVVRKLFSEINGFGRVSTPSKFAGIIKVIFTFESNLIKVTDKTTSAKIVVNTNLKKSAEWSNRAVVIKKIQLGYWLRLCMLYYLSMK